MQLLVDFYPIIIFFAAYKLAGIYVATAALMVAMGLQVGIQWFTKRTVSRMLLVSAGLVAVLGGITLALRNPIFLQWKPTVVNWLFAFAFLGSQFLGRQNLTQRIMGHAVELTDVMWRQLNTMWIANFLVLGAANLFVVYNFSEAAWVNFKLFGMLGLTLLTALGQAVWIGVRTSSVHSQTEEQEGG
jgi:intracellular septation protein